MSADRRKQLTLVAAIMGSSLAFIDATVVNAALPALARDLDAGLASQQWVVEAYMLTLAALILIGGSLGDLLGRRRIFRIGISAFGVTSLLCAAAPSDEALIGARALQGVAGALLIPSTLAIITATFPAEERGKAIGTWTAWTSVAGVVGPLAGGFLIDYASWRWIFGLNLPLVALTLLLIHRAVEESVDDEADHRVDVLGATLVTLGLAGPVFALIEQPTYGFGDPLVFVPLIAGLALFAAFLLYERRAAHPMVPLDVFSSRNFAVGNAATLALYAGLASALFFIVIFVQQVAGYSALEGGLALMPITLVMFTLSRRFGALADRIGARPLMGAGPVVAGLGLLLLVRVDRDADYLTTVLPAILLFGLGLAMTVAPLTSTVLGAVPDHHAGVASGINNAMARVAGLVAVAAVGAIVSAQFAGTLDDELRGRPLDGQGRQEVKEAKARPLAGSRSLDERSQGLGAAVDDAAVSGFRLGMAISALLVIAGGLVSAVGIRDEKRESTPGSGYARIAPGGDCQPHPHPARA